VVGKLFEDCIGMFDGLFVLFCFILLDNIFEEVVFLLWKLRSLWITVVDAHGYLVVVAAAAAAANERVRLRLLPKS